MVMYSDVFSDFRLADSQAKNKHPYSFEFLKFADDIISDNYLAIYKPGGALWGLIAAFYGVERISRLQAVDLRGYTDAIKGAPRGILPSKLNRGKATCALIFCCPVTSLFLCINSFNQSKFTRVQVIMAIIQQGDQWTTNCLAEIERRRPVQRPVVMQPQVIVQAPPPPTVDIDPALFQQFMAFQQAMQQHAVSSGTSQSAGNDAGAGFDPEQYKQFLAFQQYTQSQQQTDVTGSQQQPPPLSHMYKPEVDSRAAAEEETDKTRKGEGLSERLLPEKR